MKRCPECGFRATDHTCPLCGVRMTAYHGNVQTHSHTQQGEHCVLPNREQPVQQKREQENKDYTPQTGNTRRTASVPSFFYVIVLLIVFSVLRSCIAG